MSFQTEGPGGESEAGAGQGKEAGMRTAEGGGPAEGPSGAQGTAPTKARHLPVRLCPSQKCPRAANLSPGSALGKL